jgi:hypothetical protein
MVEWSYENCIENIQPSLVFTLQTLDILQKNFIWNQICPFLTCLNVNKVIEEIPITINTTENASCSRELCERGYFRLENRILPNNHSPDEILAMGVRRLVAHGYSPTFLMMYNEAWNIGESITSIIHNTCYGNKPIGDWFVFYVDSDNLNSYKPGPPHRDRPLADSTSFNNLTAVNFTNNSFLEVSPKYCSMWYALTNANPQNSCLYVIPKQFDLGIYSKNNYN